MRRFEQAVAVLVLLSWAGCSLHSPSAERAASPMKVRQAPPPDGDALREPVELDRNVRAPEGGEGKEPAEKTIEEVPLLARERRATEPEAGLLVRHYGVNPTLEAADVPQSSFAADVDTGSYTLARSYLERGALPPEAAVRVEEVVNAFDYGYRPPEKEAFAVQVEAFPSPNRKGYHLLHVGVKGREVKAEARPRANLVFTIDISGSMEGPHRLGLVKQSLRELVNALRPDDAVSVVVYGSSAKVALPSTKVADKDRILEAVDSLHTEGSTNVQAGLELAYEQALRHFTPGGINRVLLLSDGVANNGVTSSGGLWAKVKGKASEGVTLTTVGFGMGSYNDTLMERLADVGDGQYAYVDKLEEARRLFVEQLAGTLQVIAKDVKFQLDFNPDAVERYRLIGFENRALTAAEFKDDRVDAGEVGAGHTVTALWEVKLKAPPSNALSPRLATQTIATFRARYKAPVGGAAVQVNKELPGSLVRAHWGEATGPARLSMVASGYAEKLRGSYWARTLSWDSLLELWGTLPASLKELPRVQELRTLMATAKKLDARPDRFEAEAPLARMDFDRIPVLK